MALVRRDLQRIDGKGRRGAGPRLVPTLRRDSDILDFDIHVDGVSGRAGAASDRERDIAAEFVRAGYAQIAVGVAFDRDSIDARASTCRYRLPVKLHDRGAAALGRHAGRADLDAAAEAGVHGLGLIHLDRLRCARHFDRAHDALVAVVEVHVDPPGFFSHCGQHAVFVCQRNIVTGRADFRRADAAGDGCDVVRGGVVGPIDALHADGCVDALRERNHPDSAVAALAERDVGARIDGQDTRLALDGWLASAGESDRHSDCCIIDAIGGDAVDISRQHAPEPHAVYARGDGEGVAKDNVRVPDGDGGVRESLSLRFVAAGARHRNVKIHTAAGVDRIRLAHFDVACHLARCFEGEDQVIEPIAAPRDGGDARPPALREDRAAARQAQAGVAGIERPGDALGNAVVLHAAAHHDRCADFLANLASGTGEFGRDVRGHAQQLVDLRFADRVERPAVHIQTDGLQLRGVAGRLHLRGERLGAGREHALLQRLFAVHGVARCVAHTRIDLQPADQLLAGDIVALQADDVPVDA